MSYGMAESEFFEWKTGAKAAATGDELWIPGRAGL